MESDRLGLRLVLETTVAQDVAVLDCIGWADPAGGMSLRIFFKTGTDPQLLAAEPRPGCATISEIRSINSGLMVLARADVFSDTVTLALRTGEVLLPVAAPQTERFEGLRCVVAERNGETAEAFAQWAAYHVERFGLDGIVLLDRALPAAAEDFRAIAAEAGIQSFVHVTCDMALGSDEVRASHPFHAPDAPGKDRMGALPSEPQLSPLAELSIYEWVKWRFLGRSAAVANLDLTDLLHPDVNPFDAVHDSRHGVLQLVGQRIYPWRVREGMPPSYGDHICRQFDAARANRRWCVAPAKLPRDTVWRLVRIGGAEAEPADRTSFWRAVSMRHPDASVAEIVPKTSLIEDETLVRLSKDVWRHNPVRAPSSEMDTAPAQASDAGRTCIVTCMKNEGPFILEWVAYHRAIGVDDFLVYTNDCTDGTVALLDLLQSRGLVQRRDNPFKTSGLKPQHAALAAAETEPVMQQAGWGISMDVDEFINIHVGQGRLEDLFERVGDANMISLTWRLFGNGDVHGYRDGFITDQFIRCAPELCRKPHQAWGFKTLFRNIGIYKKMGVHRPKGLKPDLWDQIKWVNGSGRPMPRKLLRNGWRSTTDSYGYDLVTLNHYAVRSAESFLVKRDRGRVNHVDRDQGLSYWFRMNNNWEEDRSITTRRALLEAEYTRLMSDPEIAAAHAHCVRSHQAKIRNLRATDSYEAFYKSLTGPRMERLARMHPHFGANVFLAGPDSVPDDVVWRNPVPRNFFFTVEKTETTH